MYFISPLIFIAAGGVFRAYDAISTVAQEAGLSSPSLIRTSNMRKYMATMVQVKINILSILFNLWLDGQIVIL